MGGLSGASDTANYSSPWRHLPFTGVVEPVLCCEFICYYAPIMFRIQVNDTNDLTCFEEAHYHSKYMLQVT